MFLPSVLRMALCFFGSTQASIEPSSGSECTETGGLPMTHQYDVCLTQQYFYSNPSANQRSCCYDTFAKRIVEDLLRGATTADLACRSLGGHCQHNVNYCSGNYVNGQCGGGGSRKCCISSYGDRDVKCASLGGRCVDWRFHKCGGQYERGKCGGPSDRRCCLHCDNRCHLQERIYKSRSCDAGCKSSGGSCQGNTNYCVGTYKSGKCCGSDARQCCLPPAAPTNNDSVGMGSYGNIADLQPSGASLATATAEGKKSRGVQASRDIANGDLNDMNKYKSKILNAARKYSVDPAIIAGIISRESHAGRALDSNKEGDGGNGFGLMQVDKRYHTPTGAWNSQEHIDQGASILVKSIEGVRAKHPSWSSERQMQGGVAAYNFGVRNVQSWERLDVGTTGDDYSNDVIARAQRYRELGYQ